MPPWVGTMAAYLTFDIIRYPPTTSHYVDGVTLFIEKERKKGTSVIHALPPNVTRSDVPSTGCYKIATMMLQTKP